MSNLRKLIENGGIVTNRFGGQSATYSEDKEKEKLAKIVGVLVDELEKLSKLGNGEHVGNSIGNVMALSALQQAEKIAGE